MDKVILLNKPVGMTSFDCVAKAKRILHEKKIGHTGTLDLNASGLLILLCGKYTKFLPYCEHNDKHYIATIELGKDTLSKDIFEEAIATKEVVEFTHQQLQQAVAQSIGKSMQVPPMYSSKKVNGKRLMDYARNNQEVEVEAKPIEVYDAKVIKDDPITVFFSVSSGTYVRNLCEDVAHRLNNCGAMASLVRTQIGNACLDKAISLEELSEESESLPIEYVLNPKIKQYSVNDPTSVYQGKRLFIDSDEQQLFIKYQDQIIAVYEKEDGRRYKCKRGLW